MFRRFQGWRRRRRMNRKINNVKSVLARMAARWPEDENLIEFVTITTPLLEDLKTLVNGGEVDGLTEDSEDEQAIHS